MILKISLRAKAGVPKTLVKQKLPLHSLYFPQNTLLLTESRGEFSDLYSIFRLRALRYLEPDPVTRPKRSDLVFTISKFNKNTQTYQVSALTSHDIRRRIRFIANLYDYVKNMYTLELFWTLCPHRT